MSAARGRRRRRALVAALAAAAGAFSLAGCGGDEQDPAIGRATLRAVPANALVALHLSTDTRRGAVRVGAGVARRLPSWEGLRRDLLRRVSAAGCGVDLAKRPGRELSFALLPARGGRSTSLLVADAPAQGVEDVPSPCGALVARRLPGGLVAIGEPASVSAAAQTAGGERRALVEDPVYERAAAGLPRERVLDAWASGRGVRRLLAPLGGLYATLAGLIDAPGLRGAVAALVPREDGATLTVRRIAGSSAPAGPAFEPTLQEHAPADTLTYVASGSLGPALERFLLLAEPGAGAAPAPAVRRLTALGRLGGESATLVIPSERGPIAALIGRVRDAGRARAAMRALEPDLLALAGAPGGASWVDASPGGLRARTLADAPGRGLSWALDGDLLLVSGSLDGLSALAADGPRLGDARGFRAVRGDTREPLTSLVFLDPNQLLRLGADTQVAASGALEGSRSDLAKVRAAGVTTTGTSRESTVDLSIWIP